MEFQVEIWLLHSVKMKFHFEIWVSWWLEMEFPDFSRYYFASIAVAIYAFSDSILLQLTFRLDGCCQHPLWLLGTAKILYYLDYH